jgi:hypothetical protein
VGDLFCDGPDGCGNPLSSGGQIGLSVAEPAAVGQIKCPQTNCGRINSASNSFCYFCGSPLSQQVKKEPEQPLTTKSPLPKVKARLIVDSNAILIDENPKHISRDHFKGMVTESQLTYISRQHFTIWFENGSYYIEDSTSTNKTWLNDVDIWGKGKRKLQDGDKINVAGVVGITFRAS